jgi:hypothetical protein
MPPRSFIWAILVFWAATTGWLFYREFVPRFRPNQPPRFFHFDFADEVRSSPIRWFVYKDNKAIGDPINEKADRIGSGVTQQERTPRNFKLTSEFIFTKLHIPVPGSGKLQVIRTSDAFQVGLEEELQAMTSTVVCVAELGKISRSIAFSLAGKVENEIFTPEVKIRGLEGLEWVFRPLLAFDPVQMPARESFLNPMHPLEKVPDLWEGQHWRMPRSDLLGNACKSSLAKMIALGQTRSPYLDADVTAHVLHRGDGAFPCLVIDYREPGEDEVVVRTWVRKSDHMVLRQEAVEQTLGMRLVMDRGVISK